MNSGFVDVSSLQPLKSGLGTQQLQDGLGWLLDMKKINKKSQMRYAKTINDVSTILLKWGTIKEVAVEIASIFMIKPNIKYRVPLERIIAAIMLTSVYNYQHDLNSNTPSVYQQFGGRNSKYRKDMKDATNGRKMYKDGDFNNLDAGLLNMIRICYDYWCVVEQKREAGKALSKEKTNEWYHNHNSNQQEVMIDLTLSDNDDNVESHSHSQSQSQIIVNQNHTRNFGDDEVCTCVHHINT